MKPSNGAFGGPPRKKDILKKYRKFHRELIRLKNDVSIPISNWHKTLNPILNYKKWIPDKDFPVY